MKNVVLIGMMFCSLGLFAQQASNDCCPKKKQICIVDRCGVNGKGAKMKLAPMRKVDARKTSVRTGNTKLIKKAHVRDERMFVPLQRKDVKIDAKK